MIFFNVPEARKQLLDNGTVYTLRREQTRVGATYAVTGTTVNNSLLCKVEVTRILKVESPSDLQSYLSKSGFSDVNTWLSKASSSSKTLYKVVKIAWLNEAVVA